MKNMIICLVFLPSLIFADLEKYPEEKMAETLLRMQRKLSDAELGSNIHSYYLGACHGIIQCYHILYSDEKETEMVFKDTFDDWSKD